MKRIFELATGGYGTPRIVSRLNKDGVEPIGKTGKWVKAYVGKILRGAKPSELPLQRPEKFDLVINLKTATAIGVEVPAPLQLLADEVIE